MRTVDLIEKKKRGKELTREEIAFLVRGFTAGEIPDYQMSAFLMAVVFRGMTDREAADLTAEMADSGDRMDLSFLDGPAVDKHSTGGVGDKTTLIVLPVIGACGARAAKMSGRGLGHTGGTIDKLESIPGFTTALTEEAFRRQAAELGIVLAGQTGDLCPADKKMYALRDVTATVDSIPLIAGSIMSKKLASGAQGIVLDCKCGSGAFMKDPKDASALARLMVRIGTAAGRNVSALITDMDQPLGRTAGNAIEVAEAVSVLRGEGPEDLREICLQLSAHLLAAAGKGEMNACRALAEEALDSGKAYDMFRRWVRAQGGDADAACRTDFGRTAGTVCEVKSPASGFIRRMDAEACGLSVMQLGAGRRTKEESIDPLAGAEFLKKTGEEVKEGEVIARFYTNRPEALDAARETFLSGLVIGPEAPDARHLILETVSAS